MSLYEKLQPAPKNGGFRMVGSAVSGWGADSFVCGCLGWNTRLCRCEKYLESSDTFSGKSKINR